MTKKLLFNTETTYIFNNPHFYGELAGKKCKVVNWNPPNLYTIEFEDGHRMLETESNLKECLSEFQNFNVGDIVYFCKPDSPRYQEKAKVIQTSPKLWVRLVSQPLTFVEVEPNEIKDIESWAESDDSDHPSPTEEFKLGDEVQSLLPRDNYLDSFSCGKIGTIVEIKSQDNPKEYLVKFSSYSDYGDEDYHQWVSATQIKKTQESKIPDMNLILKEGMIAKIAGTDANHVVIHSEPYLSSLNTDHNLCLLNVETFEPHAIGDRQILKVWDTNHTLVYDANDNIIASLKRQAESILVKIKELETAKVL